MLGVNTLWPLLFHATIAKPSDFASGGYAQRAVYAIMGDMSQNDQKQIEELYAVISGSVQGVGFRYFVLQHARRLRLQGYTRNESNGDVEVVAQGTRTALERLLFQLRQGPSAAEVQHVQETWRLPTQQFSGFHIRY